MWYLGWGFLSVVVKDLVDSDILILVCCVWYCSFLVINIVEIIVNMVFGLIGFYEDFRIWINVNLIGRLR